MREYAIFDNNGVQFGLPAKAWGSVEEMERAHEILVVRRAEMQQESVEARQQLEQLGPLPEGEMPDAWRQRLLDAIQRWELEKERSYVKRMREVGAWQAIPA